MDSYRGGCVCGAVRFKLNKKPLWVVVCHCDPCKKRTGSAFGLSVVTDPATVEEFSGETRTFARSGDSGREVRYDFCIKCGTTVRWHVDLIGRQVFAGGAFDDPHEIKPYGEMYSGEAMSWVKTGCDLSRFGAPDDDFRSAMIERAKGKGA